MADEHIFSIERLCQLRRKRRQRSSLPRKRARLSAAQRAEVAAKTDQRCHICGGDLDDKWQADHIRAHSAGGSNAADNYLAAHATCNNYRWDYLPEEFEWTLKIGVWARLVMEKQGVLGRQMAEAFSDHENRRATRRRRLRRLAQ